MTRQPPPNKWSTGALFFALCVLATNAFGDNQRSNFLSDGPDTVGGALGDSLVAYGNDASSVFYNPAALVGQTSNVFIEHSQINEDTGRSWAALALGDPRLKTALLWKNDQLPLSSRKDAVLFGAGIGDDALPWLARLPGFMVGAAFGWVSENIAGDGASAYQADIAALWRHSFGPLEAGVGAVSKNLFFSGLQFRSNGPKEDWPRELQTGFSCRYKSVTGLLGSTTVDGHTRPSAGLEFILGNLVTVRAGFKETFRMGIGVTYRGAGFAFAYRDAGVQPVPSGSLSYRWGEEREIDYTNPLNELEAQHRSLEALLLSKIHERVSMMQPVETSLPLKVIAVAPANEEAWRLLESKEGIKPFKARVPYSYRARRQYLEFAIAYANDKPEAKDYAQRFVQKYKGGGASRLVNLVLELDLNKKKAEPVQSPERTTRHQVLKRSRPRHSMPAPKSKETSK